MIVHFIERGRVMSRQRRARGCQGSWRRGRLLGCLSVLKEIPMQQGDREFLEKAGGAALVLATAFSSPSFSPAPSLIQSIQTVQTFPIPSAMQRRPVANCGT